MAQHTAVNWILIELQNKFPKEIGNAYEANQFLFEYLFEKAKAMEKEQIMKAYDDGAIETMKEQEGLDISKDQNGEESGKYYKETYNK